MAKEKFVRTAEHKISSIKVTSKGMDIEKLKDILDAGTKRGQELGLEEADFSQYQNLDTTKEV